MTLFRGTVPGQRKAPHGRDGKEQTMKNYKIAPATYKIALRVVTWNHAIWNRNGYDVSPDTFAESIIRDAAEIGLPVRYSTADGLSPDFHAPGKGSIELSDALDVIMRNRKAHVTPFADRRRHKNWLEDMHWYNIRRYNGRIQETWAQACAYYMDRLRNGETDTRRLRDLAWGLTNAMNERKHELAARMNDPESVTQSLVYDAANELPF